MKKRILLALSLWMLTLCAAWSQTDAEITLKDGSLVHFKETTKAVVLLDLSQAEFGKENTYEEYQRISEDVLPQKLIDRAVSDLCVQFNYQNKNGMQLQGKGSNAPYQLKVCIHKLNEGSSGGVLNIDDKTSGGAKINGIISLVEVTSGNTRCVLEFTNITSDSKLSKKARIAGAFEELGFQLGKLVKQ